MRQPTGCCDGCYSPKHAYADTNKICAALDAAAGNAATTGQAYCPCEGSTLLTLCYLSLVAATIS